jgi:hypothetical protein
MRSKIRCDGKSTVLLQNFLDLNWAQVARQSLCSLVSSCPECSTVSSLASHGKIRLASDEASRAPSFAREEGYRASTICTSSHVRLLFNNCFIGMFLIFGIQFVPIILSACRPLLLYMTSSREFSESCSLDFVLTCIIFHLIGGPLHT